MKAVNLIPTEQRRAQSSGALGGSSYIVLGVLAVLLLMVAGYVLTSNNVNQRKSDAAEAKAEADQLEAEVAARGAYTNFAQLKEARVASVSTIADTRFDWERLMRELSRVMPAGSWLQTTDASVTGNVYRRRGDARDQHHGRARGAAAQGEPRRLHARADGRRGDDGPDARAPPRLRRGAQRVRQGSSVPLATRASTTAGATTSSTSP